MLWTHLLSTLLLYLSSTTAAPLLCTPPTSPAYFKLVATNNGKFHQNFNKGPAGQKSNGARASISIDWSANNQHFLGRAPFVAGLLSFNTPFPHSQISDRIVIQEGNTVAVLFIINGVNNGPYNNLPVSHAPIKFWNGEYMLFDQDALLNRLITINELDSAALQVAGQQKASAVQNVTLPAGPNNKQSSSAFQLQLKNTAAQFTSLFNTRKLTTKALASLCAADVVVHTSTDTANGISAVSALLNKDTTAFPDLLAHDEFIIAQGHMASTETIIEGTRTGPFLMSNGTMVPADGKMYRTRVMRWFRFGDGGLVKEVWEVNNRDDLVVNMLG